MEVPKQREFADEKNTKKHFVSAHQPPEKRRTETAT